MCESVEQARPGLSEIQCSEPARKEREEVMATDPVREWQDGRSGRNEGQIDVLHIGYISVLEHGVDRHDGKSGTTDE